MRSINLLCLVGFLAGCGAAPPDVQEIRPNAKTESSAQPIELFTTDWNMWRGQNQTGRVEELTVPTEWSEDKNVSWKSPVPGTGHSSPIIIGDRVFLTSADEQSKSQFVLGFDRSNGEQLWSTQINQGDFSRKHPKNSFASATPACDGHLLFVTFVNHQRLQVAALDFDGAIIWETDAGEFQAEHGYGASPTLFEDFVIVSGDSRGGGFLAALDRSSGDIIWRIKREANGGHGNYSSPVVANLAGQPQLVQTGFNKTVSFDPKSGEEIWRVDGPATVTGNTPAFADPYVIVSGGYPEKSTMCIKADGKGDVTDTHIVWETQRNTAYVPSPIIDGENVVVLTGDGIGTSFNIESGKKNWQKRIGGNFSASPIQVGDLFYITNEGGKITIFKGGESYEAISENSLDSSGGMATPAVSDNQLFIRTTSHLYCISN